MRILTNLKISGLIAISTLSLSLAVPAMAQDAMAKDSMAKDSMSSGSMKMSGMAMKKMTKCKAMSHDMMMKSASCMKMMKMHPDMMGADSTMSSH